LVPDERQSQTQDSNDEEVEEINREPYEPRMNHSGEINPSIPLPVQQTLYQISQDELEAISRIAYLHDRSYKSVNFGEDLIKEMVFSSVCGIPLSAKSTMTAYRLMIQRVHRVATGFDPFSNLSLRTQSALLKHNADLVVSLRGAIFFERRKQGLDQIVITLGINDCDFAKQIIENARQQQINKIQYSSMNTLQRIDTSSPAEQRYNRLLERVGSSVSFDVNLSKILTYVLIFMSEFSATEVDERAELQTVQETMIRMLQRYIYARYPREMAVQMFAKMLHCVGDLQELTWIKKQRAMATDTRQLVEVSEEKPILTDANKPKSNRN